MQQTFERIHFYDLVTYPLRKKVTRRDETFCPVFDRPQRSPPGMKRLEGQYGLESAFARDKHVPAVRTFDVRPDPGLRRPLLIDHQKETDVQDHYREELYRSHEVAHYKLDQNPKMRTKAR